MFQASVSNGQEYAIKMLDKRFILRHRKENTVHNEKSVLTLLNHPNLMRLHTTFQDSSSLYFVLDYCPGGELLNLVRATGGISLECARFIIAETLLAIEYLHNKKIIHRDLYTSLYFSIED